MVRASSMSSNDGKNRSHRGKERVVPRELHQWAREDPKGGGLCKAGEIRVFAFNVMGSN